LKIGENGLENQPNSLEISKIHISCQKILKKGQNFTKTEISDMILSENFGN